MASSGYGRTANAGCIATDDITVKVFVKADIYVPNAFTPNGDGLNDDTAHTFGNKRAEIFPVYLTALWRNGIYNQQTRRGWNGIYKGDRQNAGGFPGWLEAIDYNGNIIRKMVFALLIR